MVLTENVEKNYERTSYRTALTLNIFEPVSFQIHLQHYCLLAIKGTIAHQTGSKKTAILLQICFQFASK
jgi:hypothetical protein